MFLKNTLREITHTEIKEWVGSSLLCVGKLKFNVFLIRYKILVSVTHFFCSPVGNAAGLEGADVGAGAQRGGAATSTYVVPKLFISRWVFSTTCLNLVSEDKRISLEIT